MNKNGNNSGIQADGVQVDGLSSEYFNLQPEHRQPMLPHKV